MTARKPYVTVDQDELGGYVSERDVASLPVIAVAHDISEAQARRKLDGLVAQRLLEVRGHGPRVYAVPGAKITDSDLVEIMMGRR